MGERPLVLAHRGARREAPENTLPAFQRALELGADGVELDVRVSQDGEVVVFHDAQLDRLTDGRGTVEGSSYFLGMDHLDAGRHFGPAFAGTRLCTLAEALEVLRPARLVNVELKGPYDYRFRQSVFQRTPVPEPPAPWRRAAMRNAVPPAPASDGSLRHELTFEVGLAERVLDTVYEAGMADRVILSCFNTAHLAQLRRLDDRIPLAYLFGFRPLRRVPWHLVDELRLEAFHPSTWAVSAGLVRQAHARGLRVRVWTVNKEAEVRRLAAWGVDGVITDVPGNVLKWVG
jgi:glycerophosphoryl diester phosphodiesterase